MFTDKLAEAIGKGLMEPNDAIDEAFDALVEVYQDMLVEEGLDPELTEEEVEMLDELSKATLGRYLASAGEDRQKMRGHEEDLRRADHDNYTSRETVAGTLRGIYKKTGKFHVEKEFQDNEKAYSDRNSAINKAKDLVQKRGNKRDRGMWRATEKLSNDHYTVSLKAGAGETKTIKITAGSQSEAEAKGKEYAASQTKWALSKVTGRKPKSVKPEAWSVVSVKRVAGSQ